MSTDRRRSFARVLGALLLVSCEGPTEARGPAVSAEPPRAIEYAPNQTTSSPPTPTGSGSTPTPTPTSEPVSPADFAQRYTWLADASRKEPAAVDDLASRFPTPDGFARVDLEGRSFGDFLRHLPLAAVATPVLAYDGHPIQPGDDPRIAAVVAIDVGTADLQQCADSVIRLHAEWRWSEGKRDIAYHAASGLTMPLAEWLSGYRPIPSGKKLSWGPRAAISPADHAHFRTYLDDVFGWANTQSLSLEGKKVDVSTIAPGDFVVKPGAPGHAVLVLDVAIAKDGTKRALLGQGYMPAQSFQVLKDETGSPWFRIDPEGALDTPFWSPFPWALLRRLP